MDGNENIRPVSANDPQPPEKEAMEETVEEKERRTTTESTGNFSVTRDRVLPNAASRRPRPLILRLRQLRWRRRPATGVEFSKPVRVADGHYPTAQHAPLSNTLLNSAALMRCKMIS